MAVTEATHDQEKGPINTTDIRGDAHDRPVSDSDDDAAGTRHQKGVEAVQAVTQVWTRKMMWITFVL